MKYCKLKFGLATRQKQIETIELEKNSFFFFFEDLLPIVRTITF